MKNALLLLLLPLSLFSYASDFDKGNLFIRSEAPFSKPTGVKERLETCYGEPCLYDVTADHDHLSA